jgi:hypothetical protein
MVRLWSLIRSEGVYFLNSVSRGRAWSIALCDCSCFERNYILRELVTNRAYSIQHKQDVYPADLLLRKKRTNDKAESRDYSPRRSGRTLPK